MPLPKTYRAAEAEKRIYAEWEASGHFRAGAGAPEGSPPYCIVIPPPNVTGALHMGHALNATLQDILVRWHRMRGFDTLWQPGVDHAGIATQMVVERQLAAAGEPGRRELGRERFLQRVWSWKETSGGRIGEQFRRMGASCDWSRDRFTMDDGLSSAVREVFVRWYREGLIFRDKRLVNWDPRFETAISDLEVIQVETEGRLWRFRYPLADSDGSIEVATTRPETMLGDTGVAVHPDDDRYRHLVGSAVLLPLAGRRIPIVADRYADPEAGSGAVKITPAHDFNDFAVGKRAGLRPIRIMDDRAAMDLRGNESFLEGLAETPGLEETLALHGLDRFEARQRVVARMESLGLLAGVDDHRHMVPHGDRSGVPVEPHLTDQWFVDAARLAEPALDAVRTGRTEFHPRNWETTYFRWLENIEPWCISRQLWWGHRIPVWYGPDGTPFAALDEAEARAEALSHYGADVELRQDEDVLDTWFSSALWPFSTLGWPEETQELRRYYPTAVLVTAFDIIFFWVARMMMAGLHFRKDGEGAGVVPFRDVYVHAIVRDEKGQKMSKSLGNVLDPIDLVDKYGADAVRFTLASMATLGRDIRLSEKRVEGYRNFVTKLWNAARFADLAGAGHGAEFNPADVRNPINRWMVARLEQLRSEVEASLQQYRFDEAARALYATVWGSFCDWYLEFTKDLLESEDPEIAAETSATLSWSLDRLLVLLHPFVPFVTEELWQLRRERYPVAAKALIVTDWPRESLAVDGYTMAVREVDWIISVTENIRAVRAELGVPPAARVALLVLEEAEGIAERLARFQLMLARTARAGEIRAVDAVPPAAATVVVDGATLCLPLADLIDVPKERTRLEKRRVEIDGEIRRLEARLSNESFLERAPDAVVEETRSRAEASRRERDRVAVSLKRLVAMEGQE